MSDPCIYCGRKHLPLCADKMGKNVFAPDIEIVNGKPPTQIFVNWYPGDRPSEDGKVYAYYSSFMADDAVRDPSGRANPEGERVIYVRASRGKDLNKILAYVVRYSDGTYLRSLNDEGTGYVRACAHRWLPCDLKAAEAVAKAFGATVEHIYAKARAK